MPPPDTPRSELVAVLRGLHQRGRLIVCADDVEIRRAAARGRAIDARGAAELMLAYGVIAAADLAPIDTLAGPGRDAA